MGEPDFQTPWAIRRSAIAALEKGKTVYTANAGLMELRKSICSYIKSSISSFVLSVIFFFSSSAVSLKPFSAFVSIVTGTPMTGWRLGYLAGPEPIVSQMLKIHQYAIMCSPTVSQYAAVEAMNSCDGEVNKRKRSLYVLLRIRRKRLRERRQHCR